MLTSKTAEINKKGGLIYITFPKFTESQLVRHAFTTRRGGVSTGIFDSMNMSFSRGDDPECVLRNYQRICDAAGIDINNLVLSKQTHTSNIMTVSKADCGKGIFRERDYDDVDGLITNVPGVALVTQFADCTPLLLLDTEKKVLAALHSGWRGTVKQIGKKGVEKMVSDYGSDPADIIAAIGPCICKDCYEVDGAVYSEFLKAGFTDTDFFFTAKGIGKYHLDLREANRRILVGAGVKNENIDICDICTECNPDYMFSHRVSGFERGNLASIIELI